MTNPPWKRKPDPLQKPWILITMVIAGTALFLVTNPTNIVVDANPLVVTTLDPVEVSGRVVNRFGQQISRATLRPGTSSPLVTVLPGGHALKCNGAGEATVSFARRTLFTTMQVLCRPVPRN